MELCTFCMLAKGLGTINFLCSYEQKIHVSSLLFLYEQDQIEGDIQKVLGKLADALGKEDNTNDKLCEKSTDKTRTLTTSEKTACNNIVKGLKGIYGIKYEASENKNPVQNQQFEQAIGCLMLNLYAQEINNKCPIMGDIVKQAFTNQGKLHEDACADKVNNCVQCQWDECATYTINGKENLREKVKEMLLGNKGIKNTMSTISDLRKLNSTTPPLTTHLPSYHLTTFIPSPVTIFLPPNNPPTILPPNNLPPTTTLTTLHPLLCSFFTATIEGWFAHFSNKVSEEDKAQYDELSAMLAVCDYKDSDQVDLSTYKDFCEIMIKNIILTTAVGNQYKNKKEQKQGKQMPCKKIIKGIPVCDLLKIWMWYMKWFCVSDGVIKHALNAVQQVREGFDASEKYAKCAYDAALNIAYTGQKDNPDDPYYDLFETSTLHTMMKKLTREKWCKNSPEGPSPARLDEEVPDQKINGAKELEAFKEILQNVVTGVDEEENGKEEKNEEEPPPAKVPEVPKEVVPEKKVPEEDVRSQEEEDRPSEEDPPREENPSQAHTEGTEGDEEDEEAEEEEKDKNEEPTAEDTETEEEAAGAAGGSLGAGGASSDTPTAAKLIDMKDNPFLPYVPLAPAVLGISVMSYLLWRYFGMLRKTRIRYRRVPQIRGPSLEQQIVDHVDDGGPHAYTLVKERKPRSMPIKRRKEWVPGRRRRVRRRMIIDIHLEVLNECQKGNTKLVQEDFFEILVQEFMGSQLIKEENVPKKPRPMVDDPKEQVPSSDSGFRV
ncbi:SICA antigen [Plasmodium coatneyi]|uniref:SICA antigen n=1 Tax=Plasmodium coatneyi TaxID=208452 RepID=A0A1B1DU21_9APIC|nr:SICA antigen [Plasmodium coatneyi]ANQ06296.1 SICA antigen [Plasmodium coatneyi]